MEELGKISSKSEKCDEYLRYNLETLQDTLGCWIIFTGDIQFLQLLLGIKTGNCAYPCPWCNWRMTGSNRDAIQALCFARDVSKDVQNYIEGGQNRSLSSKCHGQQNIPSMLFNSFEDFSPPCLHIL